MARILAAGAAGAVVYYVWGMLAWMALPLHTSTIAPLPEEPPIVELLKGRNLETGVYVSPFPDDPAEMSDPESEFMQRHTSGPIFSLYYHQQGSAPMSAGMLVVGLVIDLLGALLAATLLSSVGSCCSAYWCRVGFVAGLGVFVALMGHLAYWNWMYFPLGYTVAFMIDVTVGWTLAGLAIAALVRPAVTTQASPPQHTETSPPPVSQPQAKPPVRNDAINLLATLQREARFVDIVKEPLDNYSDEQVGAASRDVLRDCGTVLNRLFQIVPIVEQTEGDHVEIPGNVDPAQFRLTGNVTKDATSGSLVHHGWKVQQCELPQWTGSADAAWVVAPAELEVK